MGGTKKKEDRDKGRRERTSTSPNVSQLIVPKQLIKPGYSTIIEFMPSKSIKSLNKLRQSGDKYQFKACQVDSKDILNHNMLKKAEMTEKNMIVQDLEQFQQARRQFLKDASTITKTLCGTDPYRSPLRRPSNTGSIRIKPYECFKSKIQCSNVIIPKPIENSPVYRRPSSTKVRHCVRAKRSTSKTSTNSSSNKCVVPSLMCPAKRVGREYTSPICPSFKPTCSGAYGNSSGSKARLGELFSRRKECPAMRIAEKNKYCPGSPIMPSTTKKRHKEGSDDYKYICPSLRSTQKIPSGLSLNSDESDL